MDDDATCTRCIARNAVVDVILPHHAEAWRSCAECLPEVLKGLGERFLVDVRRGDGITQRDILLRMRRVVVVGKKFR